MKRGVPDGASLFDSALFFGMSHDAKYSGHKKSGVETSHGDRHSVRFVLFFIIPLGHKVTVGHIFKYPFSNALG